MYLGGLGRSGSTLVERLLGELPGACAVGEMVHMWRRGAIKDERCGCSEPFHSCPFWQEVGEAAFEGWDNCDTGHLTELQGSVDRTRFIPLLAAPNLMPPAFRRALEDYLSYYLRVYAAIRQASHCGTVIDSSKHASLAFCLSTCPELDLRVVHVVRDSRAVAYSWTKQVSRPDAITEGYMTTYSPAASAAHWNAQNGALHLLARKGIPTLRVRYEDLTKAPEDTLRRIAAFAELPADSELSFLTREGSGHAARLSVAHTASGNPMRFATGRIEIRRDDSWQEKMPARARAVVSAATLPGLARYGYLHGRSASSGKRR